MRRGEVWWSSLPGPAGRRPALVVQSNAFNESRIGTVVVAMITTNLALENAPGNVRLPKGEGGLPNASVVNVSQIVTIERGKLTERTGSITSAQQQRVDAGLRLVLGLTGGGEGAGVMEAAAEYATRFRRV